MEFVVGRAKFERARIALAVALVAAPCGVAQAQARADSALPGANPIDEMSRQQRPQSGGSLPIRMGDKAELALGESSVNGRYDGDTVMFQGSVGLGINSTTGSGQRNPTVQAGGSVLVERDSALGLNVNLSSQYKEGVLAGVTQLRDRPWRLKGAVSYAQGRQFFDFFSGGDWAPLSQWGYFASAQYIEPTDASLGLHSAGISAWGAAASNRGPGLAPVTSVIEAPEEWRIVTDRKLVSAGHTQGVALDVKVQ